MELWYRYLLVINNFYTIRRTWLLPSFSNEKHTIFERTIKYNCLSFCNANSISVMIKNETLSTREKKSFLHVAHYRLYRGRLWRTMYSNRAHGGRPTARCACVARFGHTEWSALAEPRVSLCDPARSVYTGRDVLQWPPDSGGGGGGTPHYSHTYTNAICTRADALSLVYTYLHNKQSCRSSDLLLYVTHII